MYYSHVQQRRLSPQELASIQNLLLVFTAILELILGGYQENYPATYNLTMDLKKQTKKKTTSLFKTLALFEKLNK